MPPIIKDAQTTVMAFAIAIEDKRIFEAMCVQEGKNPREILRQMVRDAIESAQVYPATEPAKK